MCACTHTIVQQFTSMLIDFEQLQRCSSMFNELTRVHWFSWILTSVQRCSSIILQTRKIAQRFSSTCIDFERSCNKCHRCLTKHSKHPTLVLRFQISRRCNCDRGPPKHGLWARPAQLPDLPDPVHGAWCATREHSRRRSG